MKVEYGHVRKYNAKRGFGFVTRTFDNTIQQGNKDVWFHISTIKCDFPDLAQQLDDGLGKDVYFWYLIDTSEREKVGEIWLDGNNIPNRYRQDLISYIEKIWISDEELPSWLEQITIDLLGETRKDELHIIHMCKLREANELRQAQIEANHIKFEYENRKVIKDIYDGLPEDLVSEVLWVADRYRKNPLSLTPGGTDVVVEYCDGRVLGYIRIKKPQSYIEVILCESANYSLDDFRDCDKEDQIKIAEEYFSRIFARKSKTNNNSSYDSFKEVWNSDESYTPSRALDRFENSKRISRQEFLESIKRNRERTRRQRNRF